LAWFSVWISLRLLRIDLFLRALFSEFFRGLISVERSRGREFHYSFSVPSGPFLCRQRRTGPANAAIPTFTTSEPLSPFILDRTAVRRNLLGHLREIEKAAARATSAV